MLSALILRAKGHWGYDQSFLELARPVLALTSENIECNAVYCAEVGDTLAGVIQLQQLDEVEAYLDDLFIEPAFIGQGLGGLLWRYAVDLAKSMGTTSLTLDADPNAQPFYEHMGAIVEGYNPSTIRPAQLLPHMRYTW